MKTLVSSYKDVDIIITQGKEVLLKLIGRFSFSILHVLKNGGACLHDIFKVRDFWPGFDGTKG